MSTPARWYARFHHLHKTPVAVRADLDAALFDAASAALGQTTVEELARIRDDFRREVVASAEAELEDGEVLRAVESLPFQAGQTIVAVGDSITDDAVSWARMLDHVLDVARPLQRLRIVNAGLSGDTTQTAFSRIIDSTAHADWVLMLLGTNDARRHGWFDPATTTSLAETRRNIALLRGYVENERGARLVVMTPPPVAATASRPSPENGQSWLSSDVAAVADAVRDSGAHLDMHALFVRCGVADLLGDDGVHPNTMGQRLILRTLLLHLAALDDASRRDLPAHTAPVSERPS